MKFTTIGGPYGDQTASFAVTEYRAKTIVEFVNEVLEQRQNEWGYFVKKTKEDAYPFLSLIEYRYGELLNEIPDEWQYKEIEKIDAKGGWSRMDYNIHTK